MTRTCYIMEHPATLLPNRSPQLRDVMDLDFRRLTKLLTGWRPRYEDNFEVIQSAEVLAAWLDQFQPKRLALDLELDERGQVDMVGMAASPQDARLLRLPDPEGLTILWDLVKFYGTEIIVHYGEGLEIPWLMGQFGPRLPFIVHDTHKLFHAYDPEYASAGRDEDDKKEGGGSGALAFMQSLFTWRPYHKYMLKNADAATKAHYCMLDCVVAWEGFHNVEGVCRIEQPAAYQAYLRDAVPLLPIMVRSSAEGWDVDDVKFSDRRRELRQTAGDQAAGLIALYGDSIRPKSKKAKTAISVAGLKAALVSRGVKLPLERRDRGEATPSLNREARQKLLTKHPDLAELSAYWETQDVLSDCYKDIVDKDGKCHASWSGYLTSWRWRCTHPNLAQWPEAERGVFCAAEGNVLVQFDTQAGEYRWFAGECRDPALLQVFDAYDRTHAHGAHPHVANAAVLFGVPCDEAARWKSSDDPKEKAKYTFSKNYIYRLLFSFRGGIDELRATASKAGLRFSRKDIEVFDKTWFQRYPVAAAWRERQVRMVLRSRLVVSREWGYIRRLHGQDEGKLSNIALNFVTQAGIAGLINRTADEIEKAWEYVPRANMHDGLIYEIMEDEAGEFIPWVQARMQSPLATLGGLIIPVDIKVGTHWGTEMKTWPSSAATSSSQTP